MCVAGIAGRTGVVLACCGGCRGVCAASKPGRVWRAWLLACLLLACGNKKAAGVRSQGGSQGGFSCCGSWSSAVQVQVQVQREAGSAAKRAGQESTHTHAHAHTRQSERWKVVVQRTMPERRVSNELSCQDMTVRQVRIGCRRCRDKARLLGGRG